VRRIEQFFITRKRPMPASTRVQALVPEGALVLPNPNGTAPGLAMKIEDGGRGKGDALSSILHPPSCSSVTKWLVMLPGPPRELRPMFDAAVVRLLRREFPLAEEYVCQTLRTTGVGESVAEEKIGGLLKPLLADGLELGYCARIGQVDIRLVGRGARGRKLVAEAEAIVRGQLGAHIFGENDDELEAAIVRLLTERKLTLALAESCTGGGIANRITNVPGASAVFLASFVTYSNAVKEQALGVRAETLAAHGAVSEAVAIEMADGTRRRTGADFALSATGIAGPSGGTETKPVGTVFIGFAATEGAMAVRQFNPFDRETFKYATTTQALELLRRKLCG
jgi:nicotinamide-nucleotide amidase